MDESVLWPDVLLLFIAASSNVTLYIHVQLAGDKLLCHLYCCYVQLPVSFVSLLSDRMKLNKGRSTLRSIKGFQSNARYHNASVDIKEQSLLTSILSRSLAHTLLYIYYYIIISI